MCVFWLLLIMINIILLLNTNCISSRTAKKREFEKFVTRCKRLVICMQYLFNRFGHPVARTCTLYKWRMVGKEVWVAVVVACNWESFQALMLFWSPTKCYNLLFLAELIRGLRSHHQRNTRWWHPPPCRLRIMWFVYPPSSSPSQSVIMLRHPHSQPPPIRHSHSSPL